MSLARELLELINEAKKRKPFFGTKVDGFNWAVQINDLDSNEFPKEPFGRRLGDQKTAIEFTKIAKKGYVSAKGKPTMSAVKKYIKEMGYSEFYARWKPDSGMYKDDSVEIFYRR